MLEKHINDWRNRKPNSLCELFEAFLKHAKNMQGMPNSIGKIEKLSSVLFDFDHIKVKNEYETWECLFDTIYKGGYSSGIMKKSNNNSYWVKYCKSIISIANFLDSYKTIEEFQSFVDDFLTNEKLRLALPLLLEKEIFGFGFALACDFLKENVSPEFIKPDTHINYIAREIGITQSTNNYQIFKDVVAYCNEINILPYTVDKVFWLVGSGDFYLCDVEVKNISKSEFIGQCS